MIGVLVDRLPFVVSLLLVALGLFVVVDDPNLVKKVIGLNVFQTGIFLFFLTLGFRASADPAIVRPGRGPYANPLPQVLVLTAIVVGVSLTAVALALVVRIYREYGTLHEGEIRELLREEQASLARSGDDRSCHDRTAPDRTGQNRADDATGDRPTGGEST